MVESDREFHGSVAMDFALDDGRIIGFEIGKASACLPAELLARAERIDGRHLDVIVEKRIRPAFRRYNETGSLSGVTSARRRH